MRIHEALNDILAPLICGALVGVGTYNVMTGDAIAAAILFGLATACALYLLTPVKHFTLTESNEEGET